MRSREEKTLRVIFLHNNKIDKNDSVLYTPYHRWEHLFINYLSREFYDLNIDVWGAAHPTYTEMVFIGKNVENICPENVGGMLREFWPDREECTAEINIINSELAALSQLYKKPFASCEKGAPLNYREMMEFRSKAYNWNALSSINVKPAKQRNNNEEIRHISPQKMVANYRQEILNNIVLQKTISLKQCVAIKDEQYSFSLLLLDLCKLDFLPKLEKRLREFDCKQGFLERVVKRLWGGSYILWPSFEKIDNTTYWVLFCNVKKKDIRILANMIFKALTSDIDLRHEDINKFISSTKVFFTH